MPKTSLAVLAVVSSSIVIASLVTLFMNHRRKQDEEKQKNKNEPKQKKVSFRCVQSSGDFGDDGQTDMVCVTRPRAVRPLPPDESITPKQPEEPPTEDGKSPWFVSSFSSLEDDAGADQRNERDKSNNSCSSSTSDDSTIAGAVGCSTYNRHTDIVATDDKFQELLHSAVIEQNHQDERMVRTPDCTRMAEDSIVREYDCSLSPSVVDERYSTIFGGYHDIVPPLQPNTGVIIPTADVPAEVLQHASTLETGTPQ